MLDLAERQKLDQNAALNFNPDSGIGDDKMA
jgi:hypothetical protein